MIVSYCRYLDIVGRRYRIESSQYDTLYTICSSACHSPRLGLPSIHSHWFFAAEHHHFTMTAQTTGELDRLLATQPPRSVEMQVLCLGFSRTGTMCKKSTFPSSMHTSDKKFCLWKKPCTRPFRNWDTSHTTSSRSQCIIYQNAIWNAGMKPLQTSSMVASR